LRLPSELLNQDVLLLEAFFDQADLLRVGESVLGTNHFLELLSEPAAFIEV
jgi:hypothetical protein